MHRVPILCFVALLFVPNGAWAQGVPLGPEFRVNTYTAGYFDSDHHAAVASVSSGNFVVVWTSRDQDGWGNDVFGQRFSQIVPVELMHFAVE